MHLKIKRGSSAAYQNIWPDHNGIIKCPHDVDTALLIAVKEADRSEEQTLEIVQSTPSYSAFTNSTPAMDRHFPPTGSSTLSRAPARRGNATATIHRFFFQGNQPALAGSSSTFNSVSRSFGARPPPSVWTANSKGMGGNKRRKVNTETKSFRLTFFDGDCNAMQDMWDVPTDLSRLTQRHGVYSVFDITRALQSQLGDQGPRRGKGWGGGV